MKPDPSRAVPGTMLLAPCGCRAWIQEIPKGRVMVIKPCTPDCQLGKYMKARSLELRRPILITFEGRGS